jgi:HK97 family phage prohead protease
MIFLVDGHPGLDRVEADTWAEAEGKLGGHGEVIGELVAETRARSVQAVEVKFQATADETRSVEGYGAVFGNVDSYGDVIAPGAFAKSLAAHRAAGSMPAMLLSHNPDALPVGVWDEMAEDGHGLRVKGRLLDTTAGLDTYKALKAGAISGLSIGFRPVEYALRSKPEDPRRTLKSVDLLEVSIVGFPANRSARVTSVKSANEIMTIRDLEHGLRDAGYSKADAVAICARFQAKANQGEPDGDAAELVAAIRRATSTLKS